MNIQDRIESLREEIRQHNHNYYVLAQPTISDFEFDKLLKTLEELEAKHPEFYSADSPTLRVGGKVTKEFPNFFHIRPMLSLGNSYSKEDLTEFDEQIQKLAEDSPYTYILEHKFDGVSLSLHYEEGVLIRAVTRGDGVKGDEITANARTIRTIPLKLLGDNHPKELEVRGEVLIHKGAFIQLNEQRIAEGQPTYKNPRNTTAGTLKKQDSSFVANRPLVFYGYDYTSEEGRHNQDHKNIEQLEQWGFQTGNTHAVAQNLEELLQYIEKWEGLRPELDYEIDGIVIKVNQLDLRKQMGSTSKAPRWAIAYKYKAQGAITQLESVDFQIGRTGKITPVANLKPVLLAGTTVKRASIHNADEIERLGLHLHDFVMVEKGGEIIPKIVSVLSDRRAEDAKAVHFLTHCPACETELTKEEGEANHFCPNSHGCPPQLKGRIEHFAGRKTMDINGLGTEIANQLVDAGLVKNIADLYDLTYEALVSLERFGETSAQNLLTGIEESKQVAFEKVLFALGIRYVGATVAKKLARHFGSIDALMKADEETLGNVHDIGPRIAESVVAFFSSEKNRILIQRLQAKGLQFKANIEKSANSDKLTGKSFVISGKFRSRGREEMKALVESMGGSIKSSVSKKTSFLLAGDDAGASKVKKAEKVGVTIISEEEFLKMIS